ncbi:glycosyltransferase [Carnobacteriaceae bacterium zg-ZUI252]|nr:glycosyltransferase [Carnobacteriaceae bacterium zg-ZUI252]
MKDKLSIIIPAYNAQRTLQRAIDSIVSQYRDGVELLIVENGSNDDTQRVIDENAKRHPWIKALRSDKGVSVARNCGLEVASGEFVTFLDADDVLTAGAIDAWFSDMEKQYDLSVYRIQMYGKDDCSTHEALVFEGEQIDLGKAKMVANPTVYMQVAASVFKTERIKTNAIYFNEALTMAEDSDFTLRYLDHVQTLCMKDTVVYFCPSDNGNSLTRQANPKKVDNMLYSLHQSAEYFQQSKMFNTLQRAFSEYVLMNVNVIMVRQVYNVGITQTPQQRKQQFQQVFDDRLVKESLAYVPLVESFKSVKLWPFAFYRLKLSFLTKLMFKVRSFQNNRFEKQSREKGEVE